MTTHAFIVDATTFKLHLEYLFAGTGARDTVVDFNNAGSTTLAAQSENNLVAMIADGCRIRRGDSVIFYLQQNYGQSIFEGKFYGVFKAAQDWTFLDDNDSQQYLKSELGKSLTFRTLIEPAAVYAEGVTEWEALDEIKNIASPHQMLWSLIYRKLKGNRGNTMITIYEAERLAHLIRSKNRRREIELGNRSLSFDADTQRIIAVRSRQVAYQGRQVGINLLPRLIAKYQNNRAFEAHLQAHITKIIGKGINASLDNALIGRAKIEWLGNEVSCGVGMQRIDIMASVVTREHRILIPVELKAVEAKAENFVQIQRYVDWITQYYIPNRPSDIQPALIAKRTTAKASGAFREFAAAKRAFDRTNRGIAYPVKYIEFYLNGDDLTFEEVAL